MDNDASGVDVCATAGGGFIVVHYREEIEERPLKAKLRSDAQTLVADELDIAAYSGSSADGGVQGRFDYGFRLLQRELRRRKIMDG